MRSGVIATIGAGALVLGAGASAALLLKACAVAWGPLASLSVCTPEAELRGQVELARLDATGSDLTRRIFELERELAGRQCEVPALDPNGPLTPEGWQSGDLRMLYGCWDLDSTYRTRDVDSGAIRSYAGWQMCFDGQGSGTQRMQSQDGITCEGPVKGAFSGAGLSIIEGGNLSCSDGGFIHERQILCTPAPGGRASCATVQEETGGEGEAGFQRAG